MVQKRFWSHLRTGYLSKKISFRNLEPMEIPKEAKLTKDINTQLNFYQKEDQVLLAVDCIIFGFDKTNLKILLIKRNFEPEKGKWSLIGGFLKKMSYNFV